MANLHIEARYLKDGKEGVAKATVPFADGKHSLPQGQYPFSKNVYVGPDAGYSLDYVAIEVAERRIHLGFAESVVLDEQGKAVWREEYKNGDYVEFHFSLE